MSKVVLKNLTKQFGDVVAVNDLSLCIRDGEFFTLLGPSGCGKSTTLRLIAGLELQTKGEIFIGEKNVTTIPPQDRGVTMVFQSYALYPHMTVYKNLAFPLENKKVKKDIIEIKIKKVAELLRISDLLNRKPKQLSGGQKQRVALGRAIVAEPSIFLMDEPLSNLDASLRIHMRTELVRLQKDLGTTTIYVTHDQNEAMSISDRIAVMKDGGIQQVSTPREIYESPLNKFVVEFIGIPKINFFPATVVLDKAKQWLQCPDLETKEIFEGFSKNRNMMLKNQQKIIAGVRPEDIELTLSKKDNSWLEGKIYMVEMEGRESVITIDFKGELFKAVVNSGIQVLNDSPVWMRFKKVFLFEDKGQSGKLLDTWVSKYI